MERFEPLYSLRKDINNYIFVMDTNVILDIYSYTPKTIEDIVKQLRSYGKILILEQVSWEYQRKRKEIRNKEQKKHNQLINKI